MTPYNADGYFVFVAPAGVPDDARAALSDAIASLATDETSKVGGLLKKQFGGATVIKGADLDTLMRSDFDSAADLMKAASN